jgi:hypothetical protein
LSLLFVARKKEVCTIYKPTCVINGEGKLSAIIGDIYDKGSNPTIVKLNKDKIGSCFAVCTYLDIPKEFCPEIPLEANIITDRDWESAPTVISFIAIPTLAPLPYGTIIESTVFDYEFIEEMQKISKEHGFWAKSMADVINQAITENKIYKIVKRLRSAVAPSKSCDPTCVATKGIKNMTPAPSGPFINTSLVDNSFKAKQLSLKSFFHRNPSSVCVKIIENDEPEA